MLRRALPRHVVKLSCLPGNTIQRRGAKQIIAAFRKRKDGEGEVKRPKSAPVFKPLAGSQANIPQEVKVGRSLPEFPALSKGKLTKDAVNSIREISADEGGPAGAYGLPRNVLLDFRILSRPCSVVREATVSLIQSLEEAAQQPDAKTSLILTGSSGCGKSYLLLQAATHCSANGWIVLYVPRAHKLVDSSTSYTYDPKTQTYLQPVVSNQILRRFKLANTRPLRDLTLKTEVNLDRRKPIPAGITLSEVIDYGLRDPSLAPTVLSIVLEQLEGQDKFPVLLAVDGFQSLYCRSMYRNQHFHRIQSYHLSAPRLLLEYASGKRSFKHGAFLGAPTMNDSQFPVPAGLRRALHLDSSPLSAQTNLAPDVAEYMDGLQPVPVAEQLTVSEAAAMFEIWGRDGAFHSRPNDELFLSKYSEASGNARSFIHGGLLASLV